MHSPIKRNVLQHKINTKKLKPGLVAFYDIRRVNKAGLFSKEKISKGGDKHGKSEEKRASGEEYDINKQTIYIYKASKSKIESREHYTPEPTQGKSLWV